MMDQSALLNRPSIMQSLLESIENGGRLGGPRDPPSHDVISEGVDDEGDIDIALPGRKTVLKSRTTSVFSTLLAIRHFLYCWQ